MCFALLLTAVQASAPADAIAASDAPAPTPHWQLLQRIADARGLRAGFDAVPAHLAGMVRDYDASLGRTRRSRVTRALSEPWQAPLVAAELRDGAAAALPKTGGVAWSAWLRTIGGWLDVVPADPRPEALQGLDELWLEIDPPKGAVLPGVAPVANEELLDLLSSYVAGCHDALADVLVGVPEADRAFARTQFPAFAEAFAAVHDPKGQLSAPQPATIEKWKALAWKVDWPLVCGVAERVGRLADPPFVATLGRRLAKTARTNQKVDGFSGDVVATAGVRDESRVVLLGGARTVVDGGAALVIDLGGDDTWKRAAVVEGAEAPRVVVVIDLAGNDQWYGERGPAFAACGVALVVDAKGKDLYHGGRLAQGCAAFGCAALIDLEGDDSYVAKDYSQGYSFAGIGVLVDRSGNDSYSAYAYAQGGGNGNGLAALVDGGGDDRYVANGHWPDVYGDSGPGSFHGASQGYSFGFRDGRMLAGGLGLFADFGAGKDEYESGNFSQGGAYFFGFGLMFDGGGDDLNRGYRYSQGFGVHQAVGVRWDAGGNDRYDTKCAANCGAGWDQGVGWLIDEAGDDQYDVGGLALGGTANSAVAVLIDGGGADRYGGGGGADSQGGSGDSSYHQFQAIGALLDFGGGKDSYSRKENGDGLVRTGEWFALFADVKEKGPEALLALPATSAFWKSIVGGADGAGARKSEPR
jgi:hypothetical protein